jgi:putative hemolysin
MTFGGDLILIFALTLMNGFFSAAEIGVLSVRRTRLEELAEGGRRGARSALALRDAPEQFLATVQVGITFVSATASAVGGATLATPLTHWLRELGITRGAEQLALAVVVTCVSVLSIVVGELVPKSLALRSSERVSLLVARPLRTLSTIAKPLVWGLTVLSNLVLRPFRDQTSFTECRVSPEELQSMVEDASTSGSLSPAAGDIASRALDLDQLSVAAVLIPRGQVVSIPVDATCQQVWELIKQHPHARYPVVEDTLDTVDGYVTARDLVAQIVEARAIDVRSVTRTIPTFTERTRAVDVLRSLQKQRAPLAAIIDEHGMTAGIVTITDIAEELIGDVLDEYEPPDESIRQEGPGVSLVRASTPIQDVNRALGTELEVSDEYATLSGLLMHASMRIMRPMEKITLGNVELEVVEATPRQVKLVRLRRQEPQPPTA